MTRARRPRKTATSGMPPLLLPAEAGGAAVPAAADAVACAVGEDVAPAVLVAFALFPEDPLPELPLLPAGIGGFVRGKLTDAEL
jgi:hypothetical protein